MKIKINDKGEHSVEIRGKWIEVHDADSKGLLKETDACAMERERLWNKTKCNLLQNPLWFLSPADVQQLAKGRADREVLAFIKKFGPEFIDAEEENDDDDLSRKSKSKVRWLDVPEVIQPSEISRFLTEWD
jgi:hypothetical protein